jgi:CheY-like chemotaxis protein
VAGRPGALFPGNPELQPTAQVSYKVYLGTRSQITIQLFLIVGTGFSRKLRESKFGNRPALPILEPCLRNRSAHFTEDAEDPDDDPIMRYITSFMVQKLAYHPVEATNGREGEYLALQLHPLVILLDIMMPVQDGYETIRHLRARGYSGAITITSAVPEAEGATQATDCGAKGYLSKPLDFELLRLHVQYAAV